MSRNGSVPVAGPGTQPEPSLPPIYTELRAILDENVSAGSIINVFGVVKDCQLPIPTSGSDYKSTLSLYDLSTQHETYGIKFVIFRPEADMPQVAAGDVILLTRVRVQRFRAEPLSLITHRSTSIRVYTASKIPKWPQPARNALAQAPKRDSHVPNAEDNAYASYVYHTIDKYSLPDSEEFQQRAARSMNVKEKFSLLKDVQEGRFCDLIVQVAREPYVGIDLVTLYVSDYTENPNFHPQVWQGLDESAPGGNDPYGYTSGGGDLPKSDWVGPYGKMSLQITCFEPHASVVREEVTAKQWVALRNVQIKYGRDGQFLEGFMRGELNVANTKVNVHVLDTTNGETMEPKLKEALRRCRDYTKKKRKQQKDIQAAHAAGLKRKASATSESAKTQLNSKKRRKLERAANQRKEKEEQINQDQRLGLNDQITCETHNTPLSSIESILEPRIYETTINNRTTTLTMPFTCAKYQARVRVVDFFPSSLEDFACSRKPTDFDVLSDNEDDSDAASSCSSSSPSSSDNLTPSTNPNRNRRIWEWRFALQLEDPVPPAAPPPPPTNPKNAQPRPRLWVFVNNSEGQCLTGFDATDLRRNRDTLAQLRERLFTLWGNLEEVKAQGPTAAAATAKPGREHAMDKEKDRDRGRNGKLRLEKPPLESSDVEDEGDGPKVKEEAVSNKPFTCCIKRYGVYEKGSSEEGQEGEGRWVRCFGLFGTKICC